MKGETETVCSPSSAIPEPVLESIVTSDLSQESPRGGYEETYTQTPDESHQEDEDLVSELFACATAKAKIGVGCEALPSVSLNPLYKGQGAVDSRAVERIRR